MYCYSSLTVYVLSILTVLFNNSTPLQFKEKYFYFIKKTWQKSFALLLFMLIVTENKYSNDKMGFINLD